MIPYELNTRMLVIDDEQVVRDSFKEIFEQRACSFDAINEAEAALFDDPPRAPRRRPAPRPFELDVVDSGARGILKVREAVKAGRPYAAIFIDMRMPGLDGLETMEIIRTIDMRAEAILVTAYCDYSLEAVIARVGDNVGYKCKPFAPEEIRQIATKAVSDWNKIRALESMIELTSSLSLHRAAADVVLRNVLDQVLACLGASSALLAEVPEEGAPIVVISAGEMSDPEVARRALATVLTVEVKPAHGRIDDLVYFPLDRYVIIASGSRRKPIELEKIHLLRLFLQHASVALENARLHEQLARADRLAVVGRAMAQVVHDLRQPISVIHGALRLARFEPTGDGQTELLGLAERATDDLIAYVSDVADFTREAGVSAVPGRATDLLAGVVERTRFVIGETKVALVTRAPEGLVFPFDPRKLGRVLVNLVVNAVEALVSAPAPPSAPEVHVVLSIEGNRVVCEVSDNGPGIPPELVSGIFDPFVTHGKVGGSGLGLAIVKQIVEAHGGSIRVHSTTGGATFRCELPRSAAS